MSSAFEKLKQSRKNKSNNLIEKLHQESKGGNKFQDDRLYYPQRDASGNGYAVIRFLQPLEGKPAFVKLFNHGWKDAGGWLIENCPTTLEKPCPICEANSNEWAKGTPEAKNLARKRKRKKSYYANILVVSDNKNPENEGKVFIFRFGQKIFDKIVQAGDPEFEDEEAINPFDLWEGANFKLKIRKVDGNTNYDKSEFDSPSPIADSDEEIEKIWMKQYDLSEFDAPDQFKSYEELEKRFARVTGKQVSGGTAEDTQVEEASSGDSEDAKPMKDENPDLGDSDTDDPIKSDGSGEEDDDIAFFQNLADDED